MTGLSWDQTYCDVPDLKGKLLASVTEQDAVVTFTCEDGETFTLRHESDCCESVDLVDIAGDLPDLVGEVLGAEEVSNDTDPPQDENEESYTWTFVRIWTIKGTVVFRWYGTSNGYYCEMPTFRRVALPKAVTR